MSTMWPTTSRARHSVHGDGSSQRSGVDGRDQRVEAIGAPVVARRDVVVVGSGGEQVVEAREALGHPGLHPRRQRALAGRRRRVLDDDGDGRDAADLVERRRVDGLAARPVVVERLGRDDPGRRVDLAELALHHHAGAVRAVHDVAERAARAQVDRALAHRPRRRAQPPGEQLGLRVGVEHELARRPERPHDADRPVADRLDVEGGGLAHGWGSFSFVVAARSRWTSSSSVSRRS